MLEEGGSISVRGENQEQASNAMPLQLVDKYIVIRTNRGPCPEVCFESMVRAKVVSCAHMELWPVLAAYD